jgi:hypothetical protein
VATTDDEALGVRLAVIEGIAGLLSDDDSARDVMLSILRPAPQHFDEIYSTGYSNLSYLDVEQRRLREAAAVLEVACRSRSSTTCRSAASGSVPRGAGCSCSRVIGPTLSPMRRPCSLRRAHRWHESGRYSCAD